MTKTKLKPRDIWITYEPLLLNWIFQNLKPDTSYPRSKLVEAKVLSRWLSESCRAACAGSLMTYWLKTRPGFTRGEDRFSFKFTQQEVDNHHGP